MTDDRDFLWLGGQAPPETTYPEHTLWRVTKDARYADARVRNMAHGAELRVVVGGTGRDEVLMQSILYRRDEHDALAAMSRGTLQNFVGHGWTLQPDPAAPVS